MCTRCADDEFTAVDNTDPACSACPPYTNSSAAARQDCHCYAGFVETHSGTPGDVSCVCPAGHYRLEAMLERRTGESRWIASDSETARGYLVKAYRLADDVDEV